MLSERFTQTPAASRPISAVYLREPDAERCDAVNDLNCAQEAVKMACDRLVRARSRHDADCELALAELEEAVRWLAVAERRAAEVAYTRTRLGELGVATLEPHPARA
jgi:hypothetical protein